MTDHVRTRFDLQPDDIPSAWFNLLPVMAQSGVPLPAIFRAATLNNARQFKLERDYGTIEAGKVANLLLLRTNPLETMRAWDDIDRIVLRGKVIDRRSLAADR